MVDEEMDYAGLGFVLDTEGDGSVEKTTPEGKIVADIFQQFMKEKHISTRSTPMPKANKNQPAPTSTFTDFSNNMGFPTTPQEKYHDTKTREDFKKLKQSVLDSKKEKSNVDKILAKSIVLQPGFDELKAVPSQVVSDKKLKLQRKLEREKSKGKKWFNMPATEVTEEVKKDLQVLQMRSVLDPKHFYKKNDLKVLPKFFQVGKVMDSPLDYYNSRLTKKERKKTLVDELLADAEFNKYNRKKYNEIQAEKQKTHYKAYRQAKRLKKKKK